MNVLFVTYGLPYPPHGGAHVRDFFLLRALAQKHRVICLCVYESADEAHLIEWCSEQGIAARGFAAPRATLIQNARGLAQHLAAQRPLATFPLWNQALHNEVRALAQGIDALQIEHSFLIPYRDALPRSFRGKTILDLHNIGALQYGRLAQLPMPLAKRPRAWLKARAMSKWEAQHAARFDRVLTVSANDAAYLRAQNSVLHPTLVENGVDTNAISFLQENENAQTLLFVGTLGYPPNQDAMQWFCADILPALQNIFPELTLQMVGYAPGEKIGALTRRRGVLLAADVLDVKPFYEKASIVVVPLRAGGGTRLKILEAMAYGRVVISTTIGSEGIDARDGEHIVLANTAREFVERVTFLLNHPIERARIACGARRFVETRYAWDKIGAKLLRVYDELATV